MKEEDLIAISMICTHHNIDDSFIHSLQANGLIQFEIIKEDYFITLDQVQLLEQYIYFHYSLDINLEGIETIRHLLGRINDLHQETETLKTKIQFYESYE
jgi:3-keto-L-gulonate-6-phosphate decarboxylase